IPSCIARQRSDSDQISIPVAISGVIFGPTNAPNGVSSAVPPANGLPAGAVWQPTQSPSTARYRPRSIFSNAWLSSAARAAARPIAQAASARVIRLRILMPIPRGCWLSNLHERAGTLQVVVYDRVCRPIGERAHSIRGIIPGVLREGRGTHDEQIGHVPALQIAIERAGPGLDAHNGTAAGVRCLVHGDVVMTATRVLLKLPWSLLLHAPTQPVRQVCRHLEFVLVEIERYAHQLAA